MLDYTSCGIPSIKSFFGGLGSCPFELLGGLASRTDFVALSITNLVNQSQNVMDLLFGNTNDREVADPLGPLSIKKSGKSDRMQIPRVVRRCSLGGCL